MRERPTRRNFLKTAAAGAAALSLPRILRGADSEGKRPNIIYIMSDDHAAHAMSCYGSVINKTPNLDRIAEGGMRFENCFCTNSLCAPSRAVALTGKYSHMNGVRTNRDKFDGSQQTLPKLLQQAGYQTGLVGKWHLGSDPTGFDHWTVLPGQGAYVNPAFIEMGQKKGVQGYVTDIITDMALDFIRNRDKNKPFFLMCHHKAPHRSWQPDARHAAMYEEADVPIPATFNDDYSNRANPARDQEMTIERHLNKHDLKTEPPADLTGQALKEWKYQRYIKDYLRVVASVDDNIGRLLDFLEQEGLAKDTIVIYTSDNGFFLGDHGWFDKRFMYEHSLRVPLLVRYPGHVAGGAVSRLFAVNADFAPTMLDWAGVAVPADMQGRSLRPILEGKTPPGWRSSVYYHYYEFPDAHRVHPHCGVRTDRYKLIHYTDVDEWELFDLEKDPQELRNVCGDPEQAGVVAGMKAELTRWREQLKDTEPEPGK